MIYTIRINDKEYEVEVERGKASIISATAVSETTVAQPSAPAPAVPVVSSPAASTVSSAAPSVVGGGTTVRAPMPGSVLDVKVTAGQSVRKGDLLLILEAMKMENEIVAPADGKIRQVVVSKGASVATGDVLIVTD